MTSFYFQKYSFSPQEKRYNVQLSREWLGQFWQKSKSGLSIECYLINLHSQEKSFSSGNPLLNEEKSFECLSFLWNIAKHFEKKTRMIDILRLENLIWHAPFLEKLVFYDFHQRESNTISCVKWIKWFWLKSRIKAILS